MDALRQGRDYIAAATRDGSDIVVIQDLCREVERLRAVLEEIAAWGDDRSSKAAIDALGSDGSEL